jgi:hypothetical protein
MARADLSCSSPACTNQAATAGWNSEGGLMDRTVACRTALPVSALKCENEARGLIVDKFVDIWDQVTLNQRPCPVDRKGRHEFGVLTLNRRAQGAHALFLRRTQGQG